MHRCISAHKLQSITRCSAYCPEPAIRSAHPQTCQVSGSPYCRMWQQAPINTSAMLRGESADLKGRLEHSSASILGPTIRTESSLRHLPTTHTEHQSPGQKLRLTRESRRHPADRRQRNGQDPGQPAYVLRCGHKVNNVPMARDHRTQRSGPCVLGHNQINKLRRASHRLHGMAPLQRLCKPLLDSPSGASAKLPSQASATSDAYCSTALL